MKICIDARMVGAALSGIPRYAHSLISNLVDIDKENEYTVLANPEALSSNEAKESWESAGNLAILYVRAKVYSIAEQFAMPRALKKNSPNLFHSPTYSAPIRQPCPTIMSIHDLIPMAFPELFRLSHRIYYRHIVRRAAQRASAIITDTNYVKNEIRERLGVEEEKIVVIPLGVDDHFFCDREDAGSQSPCHSAAPSNSQQFILGMGSEKSHKNLLGLVKAYKSLADARRTDCRLIIVGRPNEEVLQLIEDGGLAESITIKHQIEDGELLDLYKRALLFVFPSLAEGFGLPPLEAMACGTPVVSSDATCLPEVLGDGALLTDASDAEQLADSIHKVLTDESLRASLIERGKERAMQFRWETTARRTLEVYEKVAR